MSQDSSNQHPLGVTASSKSNPFYEVQTLDGDDRAAVQNVNGILSHNYRDVMNFDQRTADKFENEAINRYHEIGFAIDVNWAQVQNNGALINVPEITIMGKLYPEEFDYEKMTRDVAEGRVDGQKGYIREDGSLHEDPIKKTIL